jgi:hypothetical protein
MRHSTTEDPEGIMHDLIQINNEVAIKGIVLDAGTIGTVVDVYAGGKLATIEFIGKHNTIDGTPLLIDLPRDQFKTPRD